MKSITECLNEVLINEALTDSKIALPIVNEFLQNLAQKYNIEQQHPSYERDEKKMYLDIFSYESVPSKDNKDHFKKLPKITQDFNKKDLVQIQKDLEKLFASHSEVAANKYNVTVEYDKGAYGDGINVFFTKRKTFNRNSLTARLLRVEFYSWKNGETDMDLYGFRVLINMDQVVQKDIVKL